MDCNHSRVDKSGLSIAEIHCSACSLPASPDSKKCFKNLSKIDCDLLVLNSRNFKRLFHKPFDKKSETILPSFVNYYFSKSCGEILKEYAVDSTLVKIIKSNDSSPVYSIEPSEFNLSIKDITELNKFFERVIDNEFLSEDFSASREKILSIGIKKELVDILSRYSVGFGVLELLFRDSKIQDIFIDSPCTNPIHIVHEDFGECNTNIFISDEELEKICSKLRIISGRPFDGSNPIFNGSIPEYNIRVSGIREPLTFSGTAFAFRKHTSKPFTLPSLIKNGTVTPETAGLLSFLVDGESAILITGSRGAGKTSLMNALLLEVPKSYRMIIVEDTPELPVHLLRENGFKIQHVRTRSTSSDNGFELTTTEAIRSALRLGESVLVIGEVRGEEAKALFEAMRIGSAGKVVLGTIHGSSAFDTFDRVVNDLNVPKSSFKAADVVVSVAGLRDNNSPEKKRKVVSITEIRKNWENSPVLENGFFDLASFKSGKIELNDLSKSEILKRIAFSRNMSFDDVVQNINFRSNVYKLMSDKNLLSLSDIISFKSLYYPLLSQKLSLDIIFRKFAESLE